MPAGKGERDKKYVGGLDSVLLVRVRPPPPQKKKKQVDANLFSIFLTTLSQMAFGTCTHKLIQKEFLTLLFLPLFYGNVVLSSAKF